MRLDEEALRRLMAVGREQRLIEFKGAGNWDAYKAKIIKAALAFPNLEGGGYLVIGVREADAHHLEIEGLNDEQLASFVYDDITAAIDPYSDPFVELDLYPITTTAGRTVVVIQFGADDVVLSTHRRGVRKSTFFRDRSQALVVRHGTPFRDALSGPQKGVLSSDSRKCQTLAASPAEPGGLPLGSGAPPWEAATAIQRAC